MCVQTLWSEFQHVQIGIFVSFYASIDENRGRNNKKYRTCNGVHNVCLYAFQWKIVYKNRTLESDTAEYMHSPAACIATWVMDLKMVYFG